MKRSIILILLGIISICLSAETLTLEQCRYLVMEHNQSLKAANERVMAQKNHQKSSFTSFLPRITATGIYQQQHEEFSISTPDLYLPVTDTQGNVVIVTDPNGNPVLDPNGNPIVQNWAMLPSQEIEIGNTHNYLAVVTLTQPLFTGGKLLEKYKTTRYETDIVMSSYRLNTQEVILKTEERYWQVVSLQEKVALATQYKVTVQAHLDDLQNYREEGFITDNDLLKVQVKLEQANLKVLQATNGLQLASMALNQMIGRELESPLQVKDSLDSIEQDNTDFTSKKDRPELKILQNSIKIAQSLKRASLSRYLPNLALEASYFWANPNPFNSFENEFEADWTIGVVAEWDLFHWNERGFDTAAISHQKKALEYDLNEIDELTDLEIRQAEQRVTEAEQSIESARKAEAQASMNLEIYNDKFIEGMVTSTDVLDAQTLWLETRTSLIDAQTNLQLQKTALSKALGTL